MTGKYNGIDPHGFLGDITDLMEADGNYMIGPRPGGPRARICKRAEDQAVAHNEQPFHKNRIDKCWNVVEPVGEKEAPKPITIHWCGIYAAHIWREAGFPNVTWSALDQKRPGVNNNAKELLKSSRLSMLAPGDILIDQRPVVKEVPDPKDPDKRIKIESHPYHHVLILKISRDRTVAKILQGNSGKKPLPDSVVTTNQDFNLKIVTSVSHAFISVDTLQNGVRYT